MLRQEAREGLHSGKETDDCAFERMIYFAKLSTARPMKERIKELRDEIAEISKANREHVHRRRIQRTCS